MNDSELHERRDANFTEPLRRVAFEEGMLLGIEAVDTEQDFHRRRLNRHQFWLHGLGTIAGLAVHARADDENGRTLVTVDPGLALDGYGREVTVPEVYGIDLRDWLDDDSHDHAFLGVAHDTANDVLRLEVTIRWEACERGYQPVLARRLNVAVDAVAPSRVGDGFVIELLPEGGAGTGGASAWQETLPAFEPNALSATDAATVANAPASERTELESRARLLRAFDAGLPGPEEDDLASGARILLARLQLSASTLDAIDTSPAAIAIDNLSRPFVRSFDTSTLPAPA